MTVQSKLSPLTATDLGKRAGIALAIGTLLQLYKKFFTKAKSNRDTHVDKKTLGEYIKAAVDWPVFVILANVGTRIFNMGGNDLSGLAAAGFFATVGAHTMAPIINSDIALYCILRSAYSFHKLHDWTVTYYHVFAVIYPLIAWQATYDAKYLQPGQRSLYFDVAGYNMKQISQMYFPENPQADGSLPKCEDLSHYHPKRTCNESLLDEFIYRVWKFFPLYSKYNLAMLAINLMMNPGARKAWVATPFIKLIHFAKDTMRSSIFLFLIVSCALQYPCIMGKYIGKWHEPGFILYSAVVGHMALRFEKPGRRAALALFCTWRVSQQMIRKMLEVKSYDSTKHTVWNSNRCASIMFAGAVFMWLLARNNPKVMKGMDKTILEAVLGK